MNVPNITCTGFVEYFKRVNNPSNGFLKRDENVLDFIEHYVESEFQVMFDELNVHIECHEIMNAIDQLHYNKSSVSDSVIN